MMIHAFCELGINGSISSDVIVRTSVMSEVLISRVSNDLECQGQGHSSAKGICCILWYIIILNLVRRDQFVQNLLCRQASYQGCTYQLKYQMTLKVIAKIIHIQGDSSAYHDTFCVNSVTAGWFVQELLCGQCAMDRWTAGQSGGWENRRTEATDNCTPVAIGSRVN